MAPRVVLTEKGVVPTGKNGVPTGKSVAGTGQNGASNGKNGVLTGKGGVPNGGNVAGTVPKAGKHGKNPSSGGKRRDKETMKNDFQALNGAAAVQAIATVTDQIDGAPNAWGATAAELTELNAAKTALADALQTQANTEAIYRASVKSKDAALARAIAALSATAKTVYATPTVTDALLAEIGFAPRSAGGVRPLAIPVVTGLTAEGFADGTVRLAWDRNGNPQGTTFQVFGSADGIAFEMVDTTTRASIVLSGYRPGTAAWFAVSAKRAGIVSSTTPSVSVYAPSPAARPALKVA